MVTSSPREAAEALPPLTPGPHRKYLGLISVVACFGGLLFGYDTGVINGALRPMTAELGLTPLTEGVVTSSLVFAAAVGALSGGRISDAWGRRRIILLLAVLFFIGTAIVVFTPNFEVLVVGRICLGLAVGGASAVVPVFLSEMAPYEIRGSIAGRNEVAIVIGQLSAFVINAIIGNVSDNPSIWRVMFAISALPAVALFIGMLRMPESPRWLVEKGRHEDALKVLKKVRSEDRAIAELGEVKYTAQEERAEKRIGLATILTNKNLIRIMLVGIGLGVAQQLTGINSIMYYGQIVLIESGFEADAALIANIAPGVIAVIGGLIALYLMDRLDRRKTFMIGLSLTTTFHLLIGISALTLEVGNPLRPWVILALVVAFVGSMQTFLNVAVWVYLSEVFPLHMRGFGIGVSVFVLWIANGFLSLYFPSLVDAVGITGTIFLFAGVGALALIFVYTQVPETRGRTLEELEEDVSTGEIYTVKVKSS